MSIALVSIPGLSCRPNRRFSIALDSLDCHPQVPAMVVSSLSISLATSLRVCLIFILVRYIKIYVYDRQYFVQRVPIQGTFSKIQYAPCISILVKRCLVCINFSAFSSFYSLCFISSGSVPI